MKKSNIKIILIKFIYWAILLATLFSLVEILIEYKNTSDNAYLIGVLLVSLLLITFLCFKDHVFNNLATLEERIRNPYQKYIIVPPEEYPKLTLNVDKEYFYHTENLLGKYRYYVLTKEQELLWIIDRGKIYDPYGKRVGSIKIIPIFFLATCLIKIKNTCHFGAIRNFQLNYAKYYSIPRKLVYDTETKSIYDSKDKNIRYATYQYSNRECLFTYERKENKLEVVLLQIASEMVEDAIR